MRRALLGYLVGSVALLLALVGVIRLLRDRAPAEGLPAASATPTSEATPVAAGPTRPAVLFVLGTDGRLAAVRGEVPASGDPGALAAATLDLVLDPRRIASASSGGGVALSAVPPGVEVSAIFFDGHGTATVDLRRLTASLGGAGVEAEAACLWAIVDTLAFNFPVEARRVRVLEDGHEAASAGGHLAIDAPLEARRDLVSGEIPQLGPGTAGQQPADLPLDDAD